MNWPPETELVRVALDEVLIIKIPVDLSMGEVEALASGIKEVGLEGRVVVLWMEAEMVVVKKDAL